MSEPSPLPAPEASVPAEKPSPLRIVLYAILAVMVVALIYEYGFVRRNYKAAETAVDDFVEQRNGGIDVSSAITPEMVQAKLGKTPADGLQDKGEYYLEHYRWVRWLPWKTYDIFVVYEKSDPPQLFNTTRPDPPGPGEVPYAGIAFDPASIPPGAPLGPPPGFPGARRPAAEDEAGAAPSEREAAQDPTSQTDSPAEGDKATDAEPAAEGAPPAESDSDAKPAAAGATEPAADDTRKNE